MPRPAGSAVEVPEGERKYLIGGNWKCNGTLASNKELIEKFNAAGPIPSNTEVAICAPFVYLPQLLDSLRDDIEAGGQDCDATTKAGAFTGQTSAMMLKDIGATWVIIGHSERREGFGMAGEPEELCAQKCKTALDAGLKVMFAIGEKKEEREGGTTMEVCAKQLAPLIAILKEGGDTAWENVAIAVRLFVSEMKCFAVRGIVPLTTSVPLCIVSSDWDNSTSPSGLSALV